MCSQLEYFETILNQYFTSEASEALKSLQGILLEKATESATEASDTTAGDDRHQGSITPDDLIVRKFLNILYLAVVESYLHNIPTNLLIGPVLVIVHTFFCTS